MTTEARLNQLYNRASEVLGPDEAETMMEAVRSGMRGDVATSAELRGVRGDLWGEIQAVRTDLRGEIQAARADLRREIHGSEQRMTKTFVTWMLASQATFTTVVAVFFAVAT